MIWLWNHPSLGLLLIGFLVIGGLTVGAVMTAASPRAFVGWCLSVLMLIIGLRMLTWRP